MRKFKLSVNVPLSHADIVREAIGNAGGGTVGEYTHCSFSVRGTGRFKPTDNANPHIGSAGQLEQVEEECISVSNIGQTDLKKVIEAMIAAHPYEETDYELTELFSLEDLI